MFHHSILYLLLICVCHTALSAFLSYGMCRFERSHSSLSFCKFSHILRIFNKHYRYQEIESVKNNHRHFSPFVYFLLLQLSHASLIYILKRTSDKQSPCLRLLETSNGSEVFPNFGALPKVLVNIFTTICCKYSSHTFKFKLSFNITIFTLPFTILT